jgi:lysine 6-dehydrogenase
MTNRAKSYAVLGAGRQGTAAAYDLGRFAGAAEVRLLDQNAAAAAAAAARVNALCGRDVAAAGVIDARDPAKVALSLRGVDGVLSAVPYFLNPALARASIEVGASFCDLGGNTAIVREELALDEPARAKGVTIVPDCGLAPGMANTLAADLVERLVARPREVAIRCGGLPQRPQGPLGYQLVFAIEGLTNEYMGHAIALRGGKIVEIPTLAEVEAIDFPPPVGRCEAFTTSGGTSTCPETYAGRLESYDYKTVRYPGHVEKVRVLRDLGLFDLEPIDVDAQGGRQRVAPRALVERAIAPRLSFPGEPDLVVLRVTCRGDDAAGRPIEVAYDVLDFQDEKTGFSAMERTTAFPAAIVLAHVASGAAPRGAIPLEKAMSGEVFVRELVRRGIPLRATTSHAVA